MRMLKPLFFFATVILTGCASPVDDMLNNIYPEVTAENSPSEIVGYWSGSMGPSAVTYDIKENGTGFFCSSFNGRNDSIRVKYSGGKFIHQNGQMVEVTKVKRVNRKVNRTSKN